MKKRLLFIILALSLVLSLALLAGCDGEGGPSASFPDDFSNSCDSDLPECKHYKTTTTEIATVQADTCEHIYKVICDDCGRVIDVKTIAIHTWSEEVVLYSRENCLVGAHTANYCVRCGVKNEDSIVYVEGEDGICYPKHRAVVHVSYLADSDGNLISGGAYECEYARFKTDICTECGCEVEGAREMIRPIGHSFGEWSIKSDPGINQVKGAVTHSCTVCGKNETEEIPALYKPDANCDEYTDSDYLNSYYSVADIEGFCCDENGSTVIFSFVIGGQNLKFTHRFKGNHYIIADENRKFYVSLSEVNEIFDSIEDKFIFPEGVNLTCASSGVSAAFVCAECKKAYAALIKTQHADYNPETDEKTDIISATCKTGGLYTYTCNVCREQADGETPPLGHKIVVDASKGDCGITENSDGNYSIYVKCVNDNCDLSTIVTTESLVICEKAATCLEPAATIYTDIMMSELGAILTDENGYPIKIVIYHGEPKGHADGIVINGIYSIDDLDAENVTLLGANDVDFTCAKYNGSSDASCKDATYHCPDCNLFYPIKVYKPHIPKEGTTWKDGIAPACTEGATQIVSCKNCSSTVEIRVEALGHDLIYSYSEELSDKYTLTYRCQREDCNERGVIKEVENLQLRAAPTCMEFGSAVITIDKEEMPIVLEKSIHHTYNGVLITGTEGNAVKYVEGMIEFSGRVPCSNDGHDITRETAAFKCDICAELYSAYVYREHELVVSNVIVPTCTETGTKDFYCKYCNYAESQVVIPALGHDVSYTVELNDLNAEIELKCNRCGDRFGKNGVKTITLDISDWFASENGLIEVATDKIGDNWAVTTKTMGTCSTAGVYVISLTDEGKASDEFKSYNFGVDQNGDTKTLTFAVSVKAEHVYDPSSKITWTDSDGLKHVGYLCVACYYLIPAP